MSSVINFYPLWSGGAVGGGALPNLHPAFWRIGRTERAFFVSAASQLPLAQNSFYPSVAYFEVSYSPTLQGKTVE